MFNDMKSIAERMCSDFIIDMFYVVKLRAAKTTKTNKPLLQA